MFPEVIKTRPPSVSTAVVKYTYRYNGNTIIGDTNVTSAQLGESNLVHCVGPRKWPKPDDEFKVVLNRFRARKTTQFCSEDTITTKVNSYPDYWATISGPLAGYNFPSVPMGAANVMPPDSWNQDAAVAALIKAYEDVVAMEVGIGLIWAEAAETASFLKNPVAQLSKLYKEWFKAAKYASLARRYGGYSKAALEALSSSWLSFRYGIVPLVMDIQSILDVTSSLLNTEKLYRAKGRSPVVTLGSSSKVIKYSIVGITMEWDQKTTKEVVANARVYFKVTNSATKLSLMLDKLGLSPHMVPSLIYEKIPYSFVLDWVVNVGDWLAAVTPKSNYETIANCVTCKTVTTIERTSRSVVDTYKNSYPRCASKMVSTTEVVDRQVDLPFPSLPPVVVNLRDFRRVIDAIFLVWQRLPKRYGQKPKGV